MNTHLYFFLIIIFIFLHSSSSNCFNAWTDEELGLADMMLKDHWESEPWGFYFGEIPYFNCIDLHGCHWDVSAPQFHYDEIPHTDCIALQVNYYNDEKQMIQTYQHRMTFYNDPFFIRNSYHLSNTSLI